MHPHAQPITPAPTARALRPRRGHRARSRPRRLRLPVVREAEPRRPTRRGDCADAPRPCPWVSCKFHLYLDVNPETGSIKWNAPDLEPWELAESCALDLAELGGLTLAEVGARLHLTREAVRLIEARGLRALKLGGQLPDP